MSNLTFDMLLETKREIAAMRGPAEIAGYPVFVSEHATSYTHDAIEPIPFSPHRSRRIWKKLRQRQRREAVQVREPASYIFNGRLLVHPAINAALKAKDAGDG